MFVGEAEDTPPNQDQGDKPPDVSAAAVDQHCVSVLGNSTALTLSILVVTAVPTAALIACWELVCAVEASLLRFCPVLSGGGSTL